MRIAVDWDGTVTEDRELWFSFLRLAKERGHEPIIVTARDEAGADSIRVEMDPIGVQVFATDGKPKIKELDRQLGHFPDIWIDDMPHLLFSSSEE